ncbi:DUF928 domain-containing protein [Coleofasciculus sp. FACHB-1120]|uniref:DUF928 domain-containing protein n=1 Tax=Coleofasciculus sp. FACHB-1120 TaxID=2692783 RepID=UPI001687B1FC|nr:DUF928 domain-containing protein [Coleofasciculus sp. FACHB-1120]MBD2744956.1 DUF928 domain-containing protein [Coleofasciculus sp. FACHB-1120]
MKFPFKQIILARAIAQRAKPHTLHLKNLTPYLPFLPGQGEPDAPLQPKEFIPFSSPGSYGVHTRLLELVSPVLIPPIPRGNPESPLQKGGNPVKVPFFKGDLEGSIDVLPLNQRGAEVAPKKGELERGHKWNALFLVAFLGCLMQIPVKPAFSEVLTVANTPPPADRSAPAGRRQGGASRSPATILFKAPPPPADRSAPAGRQRGGASRGTCPAAIGEEPLTALVPATQTSLNEGKSGNLGLNTFESVWALTAAEAPTFWYYVPYALTPDLPAEFILQDEQGNNVYKTKFIASPKQPGVVKVRLPATVAPLKVGKMYRWFFIIDCEPDAPPLVEGWVQRIAPSATLRSQLQKATPRERVVLYAKQGIWHDALTALAELRSANPNDGALTADWVSLLNSGGLEAIAQEPVIDCCIAQQQ